MVIDLQNFFKYYKDTLVNHKEAIEKLEEALSKVAPELLNDNSEWVRIYRNQKGTKDNDQDVVLPVPYYPQTDNYTQPERTCNSSACAMALEYFKPGTLKGPKGDDAYIREIFKVGDTTDHSVQTLILKEYGVESSFKYNLDFDDLDEELSARRPVVIGIMHRGTTSYPRGGHVIVVIGKTSNGDYIVHDPYGDLKDGYTTSVYNGRSAVYSKSELTSRWTVEGKNSGWGRIFTAKVEAPNSNKGVLPEAGVDLIKEFEGLNVVGSDGYIYAYPDPLTGNLPITIGWGTTKKKDGSNYYMGDRITRDEADSLLEDQLVSNYLSVLERTILYWDDMNDNQRGALLSFSYNLGANFYGSSNFNTITRILKNKEWYKVPDALYLYRNPGTRVEAGLARRRIAEGDLWNS